MAQSGGQSRTGLERLPVGGSSCCAWLRQCPILIRFTCAAAAANKFVFQVFCFAITIAKAERNFVFSFIFCLFSVLSEKSPKCPAAAATAAATNDRPHELVEIHQNQSLSLLALNGARHGGCWMLKLKLEQQLWRDWQRKCLIVLSFCLVSLCVCVWKANNNQSVLHNTKAKTAGNNRNNFGAVAILTSPTIVKRACKNYFNWLTPSVARAAAPAPSSSFSCSSVCRLWLLSMPNVNAKFIQNNCILPSDKLSWELQPQPQPQPQSEAELELELLQLLLESELHLLRAVCDPRALAVRALALIELCRQTDLPIIVGMAEGSRYIYPCSIYPCSSSHSTG